MPVWRMIFSPKDLQTNSRCYKSCTQGSWSPLTSFHASQNVWTSYGPISYGRMDKFHRDCFTCTLRNAFLFVCTNSTQCVENLLIKNHMLKHYTKYNIYYSNPLANLIFPHDINMRLTFKYYTKHYLINI